MNDLRTATDLRRAGVPDHPIGPSPSAYSGTLADLADRYILPNLPSPAALAVFHSMLMDWLHERDVEFLLRAVRGTERGQRYTTADGTRFKATDNAPAWWIHAALTQGQTIAPDAFREVMRTLPTHLFEVAKTCGGTANEAGWHIAHIFNVKNGDTAYERWRRSEVMARCVLSIHPCNYFLLPKIDWPRWGGDERVIGYFASLYQERYTGIWVDFLKVAAVGDTALAKVQGDVHYSFSPRAQMARHQIDGPSPVRQSQDAPVTEYRASRLTFKRDVIEPLAPDDKFRVVTPLGTFEMTKAQFYEVFPKVRHTSSYRDAGTYNYATLPKVAHQFRVAAA